MKRLAVVMIACCMACGPSEEEQAAAEAQANELAGALEGALDEAAAEAEATAESEEGTEAATEAAGEAAGGAEGLQEAMAGLGEAMGAAAQAEGDTPCDQAYNGIVAMVAALSKNGTQGNANMPSREQFLGVCNDLPENAQQCMVMSYGMEHQEECTAVMNDPAVRAKMEEARAVMRPGN